MRVATIARARARALALLALVTLSAPACASPSTPVAATPVAVTPVAAPPVSSAHSSSAMVSSAIQSSVAQPPSSATGTLTGMTESSPAAYPVENVGWQLMSAAKATAATTVLAAGDSGGRLEIANGRVALNTGCNTGGGSVTVSATGLVFEPIFTTRMACEPERMAIESAVTTVLAGAVDYAISDDVLTITGPHGVLTYRSETGATATTAAGSSVAPGPIETASDLPLPATAAPTVRPTTIEPGTPAPTRSVISTPIPSQPEN